MILWIRGVQVAVVVHFLIFGPPPGPTSPTFPLFGDDRIAFLVDASTLGEAIYLLTYQGSFPLRDPALPLVWLGAVHLFICPFDKLLRILFRGKLRFGCLKLPCVNKFRPYCLWLKLRIIVLRHFLFEGVENLAGFEHVFRVSQVHIDEEFTTNNPALPFDIDLCNFSTLVGGPFKRFVGWNFPKFVVCFLLELFPMLVQTVDECTMAFALCFFRMILRTLFQMLKRFRFTILPHKTVIQELSRL